MADKNDEFRPGKLGRAKLRQDSNATATMTHRHENKLRGLLVLPGWNDDGERQFEDLKQKLTPSGWILHQSSLPDASWSPADRATVNRDQALHQAIDDYMALCGVRGVSRSRMALLGFSFGAYMASFLASSKPARLLVLRSPALYPDEGWDVAKEELDKTELRRYRSSRRSPRENRSLRCCADFTGDVLLIDSAEDQIIPPQVIHSYERSFGKARSVTRHTIADADHQLPRPAWRQEYQNVVIEWLNARFEQEP